MAREQTYRGWHISYWAKPIPTRAMDWDVQHDDYDGAPDSGDHRYGSYGSLEEAKAAIDHWFETEAEYGEGEGELP